jgi:DNA-binding transcriptional LysR family regulator
MSKHAPGWDLFETFLAVFHGGSLSAAARQLQTAQPTVRRRIEALEHSLGLTLFTRSPAGLVPTDAAHKVLSYAEAMAAMADAGVRAVSGADSAPAGTVRITCSEIIGTEVLPPLLAPLLAQHPALEIELVATNAVEDMLRRDADIAVRMARPTQSGLVARRVGMIAIGLFASEIYLAGRGVPRSVQDLFSHTLIGRDRDDTLDRALLEIAPGEALGFGFRSDGDLVQLAAVRAGIGIGVCQIALAASNSRLQRVLPEIGFELEVWLVMHEDLRGTARVRLLFDHMAEALAGYAKAGAGR